MQSILHCLSLLPIMAKLDQSMKYFLGRAVEIPIIPPWQKVNNPGQTPWQNESETQHSHQRRFYPDEINFKQKEQDSETAWSQQIEELRAVENSLRPRDENVVEIVENDETESRQRTVERTVERRRTEQLIPYTDNNNINVIPRQHTKRDSKRDTTLFPSAERINEIKGNKGIKDSRDTNSQTEVLEVKRSWPEQRQKNERRTTAANYSAVEIHGFFGLIDDGSDGAGRMLIVHVPKWVKGFFMDIKQGDTIHVYHAKGKKVGAALTVLATGRHKYYGSGRRVTTCTICVPEDQWAPFH